MDQLEDLSRIIREKDNEIDDLKRQVEDLESVNRAKHAEIQRTKEEAAALTANRGIDMLMNSKAGAAMANDPRFQSLVNK